MLQGFRSLYSSIEWDTFPFSKPADHIHNIEKLLPSALCEGCIEWNLSVEKSFVDLWAVIPDTNHAKAIVQEFLSTRNSVDGEWELTYKFLSSWSHPDSTLSNYVGDVFLEFDIDPLAAPKPIIVASLVTTHKKASIEHVSAFLDSVSPGILEPAESSNLANKISKLPNTAHLRNIALIEREKEKQIRLIVYSNSLSLDRSLSALHLPHVPAKLDSIISSAKSFIPYIGIQFDIGNDSVVGLEFYVPENSNADEPIRNMLKNCEELGILAPHHTDRMILWLNSGQQINRRKLILKIRWDEDCQFEAKAYLMFMPK